MNSDKNKSSTESNDEIEIVYEGPPSGKPLTHSTCVICLQRLFEVRFAVQYVFAITFVFVFDHTVAGAVFDGMRPFIL